MELLIGADPEFALIHKRRDGEERSVNAYRICGRSHKFGCDGRQDTAEIRPEPADSPQELITHIYECFYEGLKLTNAGRYFWKAGSYVTGKPLGGHIHFNYNSPPGEFCRALDHLLGVPIARLEDQEERHHRCYSYGNFYSYRGQDWGVEYRTPASWLVSKGIAFGVLSIAFAIFYEFKKGHPAKKKIDNFGPVRDEVAWTSEEKTARIFNLIRRLSYFETNREALAGAFFIKQRIDSKKSWDNGRDIKERWGIKVNTGRQKFDPEDVWEKARGGEII